MKVGQLIGILIILVVLLVGATYMLQQRSENQQTQTDTQQNTPDVETSTTTRVVHVVTYTDAGFMPEELRIEQGETVRFVDENDADMWVASDEHPTHTQYGGTSRGEHCENPATVPFDQCETGTTYEFMFDRTGEWSYHNHVRPGDTGVVIVE